MKKRAWTMVLVAAMVASLTACGQSGDASASAASVGKTESDSSKVRVVQVGMDGSTKPFNYTDDNNNHVGYEIDILNEIDKRLDDVEFRYNITEWDGLFASLDAGKYDMLCNNITWKKEREEKYLFTKDYYFQNHTVLLTTPGSTDITKIDDLQGKPIGVESGTATTLYLEAYNEQHQDNPIDLKYTDAGTASIISNVATGRYPAAIFASTYVDVVEQELGIQVDRHDIPNEQEIQSSAAYFLFRKDDAELEEKINGALADMRADGTLAKLSEKTFGADYTA